MNKLLTHMMNAGDIDHRILPGLQKMQRGGAGKVLPKQSVDPRVFPKETLENREKVYRTVRPTDYTDLKNYIRYAFNNDRDEWDDARSEEAFKMYLGLQPKPEYFRPSKYKPTINATPNEYYYSADDQLEQDIFNSFKDKVKPGQILPTDEWFVDSEFPGNPNAFWENGKQMIKFEDTDTNPFIGRPMVSRARALGQFVVSRGNDDQGEYLSYADQYDFPEKLQNKMQGLPYKIYGRVYYPKDKPKKVYGGENPFLDMLKQKYGGQPFYQSGGVYDQGGPILDPRGQWAHPGKITRIPSDNITMQGVPYPVFGVGSNGQEQMMYPDQEYNFGGASYVDEYPMMRNGGGLLSKTVSCSNCGWFWKAVDGGADPLTCHKCGGMVKMKSGGQHGGLDRWFAEKWVDVKTGKDCGRQEGESRAGYPACRPSKRVNSQTPKTSSEMSSAEKAKFKSSKTSSQRIDYNHKRNK